MFAYLINDIPNIYNYKLKLENKKYNYLILTNDPKDSFKRINDILPYLNIKYERYEKYLLLKEEVNYLILEYLKKYYELIMIKNSINKGDMRLPNHKILYIKKFTYFYNYLYFCKFLEYDGYFKYEHDGIEILSYEMLNKVDNSTDNEDVTINDAKYNIIVNDINEFINANIKDYRRLKIYKKQEYPNYVCEYKQNGIKYTWSPFYSMFSSGNIKEKIRLSNISLNIGKEVILDMFSGIGYLILPLLKNGSVGISCEINIMSIMALINNLKINKCKSVVCIGDCREYLGFYKDKCNRVLMGYLPEPLKFIEYAVAAIKNHGIIHYHTIYDKQEFVEVFKMYCKVVKILKVNKIKSYSRFNDHLVYDIYIEK